jgi:hypothetical protein
MEEVNVIGTEGERRREKENGEESKSRMEWVGEREVMRGKMWGRMKQKEIRKGEGAKESKKGEEEKKEVGRWEEREKRERREEGKWKKGGSTRWEEVTREE